jgi:uncharacterized protein (TIGR02147 family)
MKKRASKINLFKYLDYRSYLLDWYRELKTSRNSVSFREFSKRAGLKSTGYLKLVMEGKRNLTDESVEQFILALGLNKQEQEFFRSLVHYNQAKTIEQKDAGYQRLLRSRKFSQLRKIDKEQYEYYADWYHPVVRELILSTKYDGTPESIAKQISPAVTPAQVEKSIQLLEKLGFIEKTPENRWKQASSLVSTGAEVASHIVFTYQKNLLDLSKETLQALPPAKRDVSTMTLGIAPGRLPQLKKMIQDFRKEVLKLVAVDTEIDKVVQLNIQLFPLAESASNAEQTTGAAT